MRKLGEGVFGVVRVAPGGVCGGKASEEILVGRGGGQALHVVGVVDARVLRMQANKAVCRLHGGLGLKGAIVRVDQFQLRLLGVATERVARFQRLEGADGQVVIARVEEALGLLVELLLTAVGVERRVFVVTPAGTGGGHNRQGQAQGGKAAPLAQAKDQRNQGHARMGSGYTHKDRYLSTACLIHKQQPPTTKPQIQSRQQRAISPCPSRARLMPQCSKTLAHNASNALPGSAPLRPAGVWTRSPLGCSRSSRAPGCKRGFARARYASTAPWPNPDRRCAKVPSCVWPLTYSPKSPGGRRIFR